MFSQQMTIDFDKELHGLKTYSRMFQTKDAHNFTKFNNWNFTSPTVWDGYGHENFYFDKNTTLLFRTQIYTIGKEQPDFVRLDILPEIYTKKGTKVTTQIFGIPVAYGDDVINIVNWLENTNVDERKYSRLRSEYVSDTIFIQMNFDFTRKEFVIHYFGVFDIMSKLGGFKASIGPLVNIFAPIFILLFLISLSWIIKESFRRGMVMEVRQFIHLAQDQFPLIKKAIDSGTLKLGEGLKVKLETFSKMASGQLSTILDPVDRDLEVAEYAFSIVSELEDHSKKL